MKIVKWFSIILILTGFLTACGVPPKVEAQIYPQGNPSYAGLGLTIQFYGLLPNHGITKVEFEDIVISMNEEWKETNRPSREYYEVHAFDTGKDKTYTFTTSNLYRNGFYYIDIDNAFKNVGDWIKEEQCPFKEIEIEDPINSKIFGSYFEIPYSLTVDFPCDLERLSNGIPQTVDENMSESNVGEVPFWLARQSRGNEFAFDPRQDPSYMTCTSFSDYFYDDNFELIIDAETPLIEPAYVIYYHVNPDSQHFALRVSDVISKCPELFPESASNDKGKEDSVAEEPDCSEPVNLWVVNNSTDKRVVYIGYKRPGEKTYRRLNFQKEFTNPGVRTNIQIKQVFGTYGTWISVCDLIDNNCGPLKHYEGSSLVSRPCSGAASIKITVRDDKIFPNKLTDSIPEEIASEIQEFYDATSEQELVDNDDSPDVTSDQEPAVVEEESCEPYPSMIIKNESENLIVTGIGVKHVGSDEFTRYSSDTIYIRPSKEYDWGNGGVKGIYGLWVTVYELEDVDPSKRPKVVSDTKSSYEIPEFDLSCEDVEFVVTQDMSASYWEPRN